MVRRDLARRQGGHQIHPVRPHRHGHRLTEPARHRGAAGSDETVLAGVHTGRRGEIDVGASDHREGDGAARLAARGDHDDGPRGGGCRHGNDDGRAVLYPGPGCGHVAEKDEKLAGEIRTGGKIAAVDGHLRAHRAAGRRKAADFQRRGLQGPHQVAESEGGVGRIQPVVAGGVGLGVKRRDRRQAGHRLDDGDGVLQGDPAVAGDASRGGAAA